MKYYKITLGQEGTKLIYPDNYQAEIGDLALDHLYYDEGLTPMLLLVLPDSAQNIVRQNVVEITEDEAKAISEKEEIRTEKIIDEGKLRRLELKAKLKQTLTTEELGVIDIASPKSIFKIEKILADRIDNLKALGK